MKIKVYGFETVKMDNGRFRLYYDDASMGVAYFVSEIGFKTKDEADKWAHDNLEIVKRSEVAS